MPLNIQQIVWYSPAMLQCKKSLLKEVLLKLQLIVLPNNHVTREVKTRVNREGRCCRIAKQQEQNVEFAYMHHKSGLTC